MNALGIHLTLLAGPTVPAPAPPFLMEALDGVEVKHDDSGRSGFQITFRLGRSGPSGVLDYRVINQPQLQMFSRVILMATFGAMPRVLMDGIVTDRQFVPGEKPGDASLTVTGEDVSVMMDQKEVNAEHPAQPEPVIVLKIITSYAQYGLIPMVIPPVSLDIPLPIERIPVQNGTDLGYLKEMAERYGYAFYITPGPAPMTNTAYWGPPVRVGLPQKAISVNMGSQTNASITSFHHNGQAPELVEGEVQDRQTGQNMPIKTFASTRIPLSSQPAIVANQQNTRRIVYRGSGMTTMQAMARAQGKVDASTDETVVVEGELDAARYGSPLQSRSLVGVRGAGYQHDGFYYVKSVTHLIRRGQYRQRFVLTREGLGALSPVVRP